MSHNAAISCCERGSEWQQAAETRSSFDIVFEGVCLLKDGRANVACWKTGKWVCSLPKGWPAVSVEGTASLFQQD